MFLVVVGKQSNEHVCIEQIAVHDSNPNSQGSGINSLYPFRYLYLGFTCGCKVFLVRVVGICFVVVVVVFPISLLVYYCRLS